MLAAEVQLSVHFFIFAAKNSKIMITEEITKAVETLRSGGVILYPTDTVWGLGCDATDPSAVARIFRIKERSDCKSLVLLADDMNMIARYVRAIPDMAIQLVEINDKPMTIIYPGALVGNAPEADSLPPADPYKLAYNVVAEDRSVGIRIPLMKFCVELVRRFGRPVVSTSANISGEPSPRNFKEISQVIKDSADYIVDQSLEKGSTGRPSSIIKVELDSTVKIIR